MEAIPGHLSHVVASWNTGMCVEFFFFFMNFFQLY